MTDQEILHYTYTELAAAIGWIKPGETIADIDPQKILDEALDLIELGHRYEGLE